MSEPEGNTVYCIAHSITGETYVGWSNRVRHRLRQHNKELSGGAKRTNKTQGLWRPVFWVTSMVSKQHAMQLEWRLHRNRDPLPKTGENPFGTNAVARRCWRLQRTLSRPRVTNSAPLTVDTPLKCIWFDAARYTDALSLDWPRSVTHVLDQGSLFSE